MKNSDVKQLSATHFSLIFGSSGAQFFGPAMTFTPQRPVSFTKATWWGLQTTCNDMASTHLKSISQIGSFPQVGMKIRKCLKPPSWYNFDERMSTSF